MRAPSAGALLTNFEVALFLQREKHRLANKHHEFVDDMVNAFGRSSRLTRKQAEYLYILFNELGGRII
jgi:hypothetical protein